MISLYLRSQSSLFCRRVPISRRVISNTTHRGICTTGLTRVRISRPVISNTTQRGICTTGLT
uniref:Uncharacterized protein n=1 Tax=Ascaris lumbricoides TaxID=6252 RepID=A0A0M3IXS4_ASCLU